MNTLFARLSLVLLVIVVLMGGAFYAVDRINSRLYYEELSQTLNAPIAMYVTEQETLIRHGVADLDALNTLASRAMVINPTAEIYLLDREGRILGHALPGPSALERVDLGPLRALIEGNARLPLRGEDPRDGGRRKIFSAAEVRSENGLEGYLYVVLGGQTYEALARDIGASYAGRASAIGAVTIAALAIAIGLLTFGLLTRRLVRLRREVRRVVESDFTQQLRIDQIRGSGDEIDDLARACADMIERIREQIGQLTENDRLRRELISNVSHDLRTPLSAMQGYVETLILRNGSLSEEENRRFLDIVRKHTLRLGRLIGDLFELSKLDATTAAPTMEAFSLPELVQDILQEFRLESEQKGIDLSIDIATTRGQTVGDIGLIQRVLENLVRNAIKFTPEGGRVIISIAERSETLAVAVSDNGPGIAAADVPKIFDRFYRARDGEEARSDSSGIGLAIVKRILDLHGSRITVTSEANAETRFEFELPRQRRAA